MCLNIWKFPNNLAGSLHFTMVWSMGYQIPPWMQIHYAKWALNASGKFTLV